MGGAEFVFLVVLGVIIFGPDKLPDLARKIARVVHYLRGIANDARTTLTEELGTDLVEDLNSLKNPRALVREHLFEEGQAIVHPVAAVADEIKGVSAEVETREDTSMGPPNPLFDPEAT